MAHFPKPFYRSDRGLWYVQLRGKQIKLGREKVEAFSHYHDLMKRPAPVQSQLAIGIIEGFLDWCQKHRAPGTYDWYQARLESFANFIPDAATLYVDDLKPYHVIQWVDAHPNWGNTNRRGAIIAVQRAFLWAEKFGHIIKSPIRYVEKPQAEHREQIISEKEYRSILSCVRDRCFRELLQFAWETGARPQEIRKIEARHFNHSRMRIEIPPKEAKGKKRWRIIYLTDTARNIIQKLCLRNPSGKLFRNTDGKPWTKDAIPCRFYRIQKKTGVRYALYSFQHSFANRMLVAGCDPLTVSTLLGHADGTMLAKVYSHLDQRRDHLQDSLDQFATERVAV